METTLISQNNSGFEKQREMDQLLDKFSKLIKRTEFGQKYHYQSPELKEFYTKLPFKDMRTFHILALTRLIDQFDSSHLRLCLPLDVMQPLYDYEFNRIKNLFDDHSFEFDWSNDLFVKDLAICSGRMFPIGPGVVEISGIPRILFLKYGFKQFFRMLCLTFFRTRGTKPFLANHTHLANAEQFNPEGWQNAYKIVAALLRSNPDMKGFLRSSWFIDPAITQISPRLSYLRKTPEANGALSFFMCEEDRRSGAFTKSKSRLALFEKAEYTPRVFYLIWPREQLIEYSAPD